MAEAALFSAPRLDQLHNIWTPEERLDVIRRAAPWWKKIGVNLKFEYHALEDIKATFRSGSESCCERLFQRWLGGAGVQPATWAVLLEALEDSNLYSLAKEIRVALTTQFYAGDTGVMIQLSSAPRLALLKMIEAKDGKKIEIIKIVAPRWKDVGDLLDFDETGETLKQIEADKSGEGVESCCRAMFQLWLEGMGIKPVSWGTLLKILDDCRLIELAAQIKSALTYEFQYPTIQGADIVAQTRVEINPEKPLTYRWERHGFEVHIPADAISSESGPVTLSIQASLSGDYQLPDDRVLVSGVYWLALQPPVKFAKKATVAIQHCASVKDDKSLPVFATAKCTQKQLPYKFKPLEGGLFPESEYASIEVSHFSALGIFSWFKSKYAICSYYTPKTPKTSNIWDLHITITPKEDLLMEKVKESYTIDDGAEQGPGVPLVTFSGGQISLDTPSESWDKDGWKLCPLTSPSIPKAAVDDCKGRTSTPAFLIQLKMQGSTQSLEQKVKFVGVEPGGSCITITREPQLPAESHPTSGSTSSPPTSSAARPIEPPALPELLRLRVPQTVGAHYSTFGILLLNDTTGSRLAAFKKEYQGVPEDVVLRILQEWLEGRGSMPVSWKTLIETLRDTGLRALAEEIRAAKN